MDQKIKTPLRITKEGFPNLIRNKQKRSKIINEIVTRMSNYEPSTPPKKTKGISIEIIDTPEK